MEAVSELMLGEISKEQFLIINAISEIDTEIEKGLIKAYQSQCADSVEVFIYLIFKFKIFDEKYIRACSHKNSVKNHGKHDHRKKNGIQLIITGKNFPETF